VQVNARKIYDEPNALSGILDNKLFVAILAGEAVLQARVSRVLLNESVALPGWFLTLVHKSVGLSCRRSVMPVYFHTSTTV